MFADGKGRGPHSAQRLRILLVTLITNTAVEEGWVVDASSYVTIQGLRDWFQEREDKFGKYSPQSLPLDFYVYQEDILAVAIGKKAANIIEEGLPHFLLYRHGYSLVRKRKLQNLLTLPYGLLG